MKKPRRKFKPFLVEPLDIIRIQLPMDGHFFIINASRFPVELKGLKQGDTPIKRRR